MIACTELSIDVGTAAACRALDIARPTFYRRLGAKTEDIPAVRPSPPRSLSAVERHKILDVLHTDRFVDKAPSEVYATLLDEDAYLCSIRTMYRILEKVGEVRERRDQARHPKYKAPELLATGPNQVWSWDITKLLGPVKWSYFYLYVILDIFSRYVVGWMIAPGENSALAKRFIAETCEKQNITPGQLALHADRGSSMKSKTVAFLLADLGITKSHSRPHVSDDNPYSESQFKTLKYCPGFPDRFGSIQDARAFCQNFFRWYNLEHHHSGIGLLTPKVVHYGNAQQATAKRQIVLSAAFDANPERFVRGMPKPPSPPEAAWINKPKKEFEVAEIAAVRVNSLVEAASDPEHKTIIIAEDCCSNRDSGVKENYSKFDKQVSQSH